MKGLGVRLGQSPVLHTHARLQKRPLLLTLLNRKAPPRLLGISVNLTLSPAPPTPHPLLGPLPPEPSSASRPPLLSPPATP